MSSIYMLEAMEYAKKGIGLVYTRPLLGVVIVIGNEIISTGYSHSSHINEGLIEAIQNSKQSIKGATIYMNIEPYYDEEHTYALDLIINHEIKCVVIGSYETINTFQSVRLLRENQVAVIDKVLDKECIKLNEIYFKYSQENKPYLMMKFSMSLDGIIAPNHLLNKKSQRFLDYLRTKANCLLISVESLVQNENLYSHYKNKLIIIFDPQLEIPLDLRFLHMEVRPTIYLITKYNMNHEKIKRLKLMNIQVINLFDQNHRLDLSHFLIKLGKLEVDSILIEASHSLNFSIIDPNHIDKVYTTLIPFILGKKEAIQALPLQNYQLAKFENEIMFESYIQK